MAETTRRAVLVGVAAGTAVGATVGLADPAAASTGVAGTTPLAGVLRLTAHDVRRLDAATAVVPGTRTLPKARAGDRCVVAGTVSTPEGGVGTFHADVVRLHDAGQLPHGGAASTLEHHVLTLPTGTLIGSGTLDRDGRGTFAIIGGTARYAAARGSYTLHVDRGDLGGDGTARFDITFQDSGVGA